MTDPRDQYIARVVKGRSFADVGGLWGTVNEKVSVAHRCGASELTMIDLSLPGRELWRLFEERRRALGVPEVRCISSDILILAESASCPEFDVVHCSGVLYHTPDPLRFLVALRKITREWLVLTSSITATRVKTKQGVLELPRAAALFLPALQGRERAIVKAHWQPFLGDENIVGLLGDPETLRPDDFAPWWWLPTVEALRGMCAVAGFAFEEGTYMWGDNAYVQLLSAR